MDERDRPYGGWYEQDGGQAREDLVTGLNLSLLGPEEDDHVECPQRIRRAYAAVGIDVETTTWHPGGDFRAVWCQHEVPYSVHPTRQQVRRWEKEREADDA